MNLKHTVFCALLFLVTMGCKKGDGLQLGPAIIVIPDPTSKEFTFSASVKNFDNVASPEAYLYVIVNWAPPHLSCEGPVSSVSSRSQKIYTIPPLQPNEAKPLSSLLVTEISDNTNCHCKQEECAGTISFTLLKEKLPEFVAFPAGPNKSVKVQWSADGNVANLVRTDLNGAIPQ